MRTILRNTPFYLTLFVISGCGHHTTTTEAPDRQASQRPDRAANEDSRSRTCAGSYPSLANPGCALEMAPSWLAEHPEILIAERRELVAGVQVLHLGQQDRSLLCLEATRPDNPRQRWCWTETSPVTRLLGAHGDAQPEGSENLVRGLLALEHADQTRKGIWFRLPQGEWHIVPGLPLPPPAPLLPPWFAGPSRRPPNAERPSGGFSAIPAMTTPVPGPLSQLKVQALRPGAIELSSETMQRLCIREETWRCTATVPLLSENRPQQRRTLDAFPVGGGTLAVLRAHWNAPDQGQRAQGTGELFIELYERVENNSNNPTQLAQTGRILAGGVHWSVRGEGAEALWVTRTFHRVRPENGCLRIEDAVTDEGTTRANFRISRGGRRNNPVLADASRRVAYAASGASTNAHVLNLAGLWEVDDSGIRRVDRCESNLGPFPSCPGKLPVIPAGLPDEVRVCLEEASNAAMAHRERAATRNGQPCGAVATHRGTRVSEFSYQYEGGRRTRTFEERPRDLNGNRGLTNETIENYRQGLLVSQREESTQYWGEQPDCRNIHQLRISRDRRGRPTRRRHRSEPCEGDLRRPWFENVESAQEDGFEVHTISEQRPSTDARREYFIPDAQAPQATATCAGDCRCEVQLRDCEGFPVAEVSLRGGQAHVVEYLYECRDSGP